MKYKITFWVLLAVSGVLFFAPISVQEGGGMGLDKLVHLVLFAGLVFLGIKAFRRDSVAGLLFLYAPAVELVQGQFLPFRSFDWWDMIAGWVGLVLAYYLMIITAKKKQDSSYISDDRKA